jgi:NadR type nicotinamide-nucleotide adenylyltransferase
VEKGLEKANSKAMKRVAITGPESSGKSDLSKALALHFNTTYAREYARLYLAEKGFQYGFEDLDMICDGQLREEKAAVARARRVVFFDTDTLVLKIWSEYRFGQVSPKIQSAFEESQYDLYLLCKPDIPWYSDPLRESPNQDERDELFNLYRDALEKQNQPYQVIVGIGQKRVDKAIDAVLSILDEPN